MKFYRLRFTSFVILSILFQLATVPVLSQPTQVDFDTFRKELNEAESEDEKLDQYMEFSFNQLRNAPDSLFKIAEEINKLSLVEPAKRTAYQDFILANAWRRINPDSSRFYAAQASEQFKKLDIHENYLRAQNLLGSHHIRYGEVLEAEAVYVNAIRYHNEYDVDKFPQHYFYGNLGNLYARLGAYDLSITMYERMLDQSDNESDQCNIISTLASNLAKVGKPEKAEEMLRPCLEQSNLSPPIASIVRSNLSKIMLELQDYDEGVSLLEEAADLSFRYKIPNLNIAHQVRLGDLYLQGNRVSEAGKVADRLEDPSLMRSAPVELIKKNLFLARLQNNQEMYVEALAYVDQALSIAEQAELQHELEDAYMIKSQAFEGTGDMYNALAESNRQLELNKHITEFRDNRSLAEAKVRHQLIIHETELASTRSELISFRNRSGWLLILAAGLILLLGFLFKRYSISRSKEAEISKELSEKEKQLLKLREMIKEQNRKFREHKKSNFVQLSSQLKLAVDDIRYVQSDGNYMKVYLSDVNQSPILERLTLKDCEKVLPKEIFKRIHRSTIVNLRHVAQVEGEILTLKDGTRLKMSRREKKEFFG